MRVTSLLIIALVFLVDSGYYGVGATNCATLFMLKNIPQLQVQWKMDGEDNVTFTVIAATPQKSPSFWIGVGFFKDEKIKMAPADAVMLFKDPSWTIDDLFMGSKSSCKNPNGTKLSGACRDSVLIEPAETPSIDAKINPSSIKEEDGVITIEFTRPILAINVDLDYDLKDVKGIFGALGTYNLSNVDDVKGKNGKMGYHFAQASKVDMSIPWSIEGSGDKCAADGQVRTVSTDTEPTKKPVSGCGNVFTSAPVIICFLSVSTAMPIFMLLTSSY